MPFVTDSPHNFYGHSFYMYPRDRGPPLWWREDHLCFLALPEGDFTLSLLWIPVEYEVIGIKISLSKFLSQKKVECPLWSGDELLPQVEEFRYLVVMSERS